MNQIKQKIAIFVFNGDLGCFVHALLNAIDMNIKGHDVRLIIEGQATSLIGRLNQPGEEYYELYNEAKSYGLIDCVCQVCANKYKALEDAKKQNLPLCTELKGHPSMASFIGRGYRIITI